jgi:hypothetical protein
VDNLSPEQKIRWQSLLVALSALDYAGEEILLAQCDCGAIKIAGNSGQVQWDFDRSTWAFDGADGSEMYV